MDTFQFISFGNRDVFLFLPLTRKEITYVKHPGEDHLRNLVNHPTFHPLQSVTDVTSHIFPICQYHDKLMMIVIL